VSENGHANVKKHIKQHLIQCKVVFACQVPYLLNFVGVNINVKVLSNIRLIKLPLDEGHWCIVHEKIKLFLIYFTSSEYHPSLKR
jgi:hypothetical protein